MRVPIFVTMLLLAAWCVPAQTFTSLQSLGMGLPGGYNPQGPLIQGPDGTFYGTAADGGAQGNGTVFSISTNNVYRTLYNFTGLNDGETPSAGLILSGNTLYGTTYDGGTNGDGVVFELNTDGSGFTNLHNFTGGTDGAYSSATLIVSSNALYGTTSSGGIGGVGGAGVVFTMNTDGTGFTNLYSFTGGADGANPHASLILSGNTLYGTTSGGGTNSGGVVFAVNTDGSGFTNLYSFTGGTDGANPNASLILSGNTLYGMTSGGGINGAGVVFAVNTDGSGFTTLDSFISGNGGANPYAGLVRSGNTFYGTTSDGGINNFGVVFAMNADGSGLTNLYWFTGGADGGNPYAGLTLSGNTLYGTTYGGGTNGFGVVFAVNTDGSGFTNLYSFTGGTDGSNPRAGLILSGNTLYGTTYDGGSSRDGVVFAVNTDGSGFTNLHSFIGGTGGLNPYAGLILSGTRLYGTTYSGGTGNRGMVFGVNTNGSGFTNICNFPAIGNGENPYASLLLYGNTLYGTTWRGGTGNDGVVFTVNTDGSDFTNLYRFTGGTNGANPRSGLILSSNTLYGTTSGGGAYGSGSIFSLTLPDTVTANAITYSRNDLNTWHVRVSLLLTNAVDFFGNPLFLSAVSTSSNGVAPLIGQGYVQYYNTNLVDDQFTYTVTNDTGLSATGTITLQAAPLTPMGGQINSFTLSGGSATMTFGGVSGYWYYVQVSTNLTDWTTLETTNAPVNGIFQFIDTTPPNGSAFYRLQWAGANAPY